MSEAFSISFILYYTKALSDPASSLAPDWIHLLQRPRIPASYRSATTFQWKHKVVTTGPPWKSLLGLSHTRATSLMEEALGRMGPRPRVRCLHLSSCHSSFWPVSICSSASFFLLHLVPLSSFLFPELWSYILWWLLFHSLQNCELFV